MTSAVWMTADEWFAQFLASVQGDKNRRRRAMRERSRRLPQRVLDAREFDEKTEQLTRYLRGERLRKDAGNGE